MPEPILALAINQVNHSPVHARVSGRRHGAVSTLFTDIRRHDSEHIAARYAVTNTSSHANFTLVETLWQENQELVEKFLNNEFIKLQAEGEQDVTLPSYQYYSTQDYYYLVNYVQYKALRMTTYSEVYPTQLLSVMTEETAAISGDIDYAWSYRNTTLAEVLAVPLDAIDSGALDGWVKLAEYWAGKNTTRKDTLFYNTWVEPNNDPSYADDLISFLEANKDAYYSANANQTWTAVFREALQFEIDFFDSALGKSPADL
ncbi:putative Thiaminase-2/PQQC domain-containing protein [Seiridium unicorne]|uniref:Thiaminase-2/PQQC domain-containing protein n=1 Tax=Seiridium unicorne TaxID=138068 RepID=A0ABR2UVV6_9PEZI